MDTLIDPTIDREVHCGTVLRIFVRGKWQWARYEKDRHGIGYFVLEEEFCVSLDEVTRVDWHSGT